MEHAANIGSNGIPDVVEGAVMPLRVAGISPESLRRRLGLKHKQAQCENSRINYSNWFGSHSRSSVVQLAKSN